MGNPFKGGGDGGGRDGGDKTGDGGGFFKSAWEAVSQDIWGGPPQRKQESSTTPKNPIQKAFEDISHLSLDAIPAISQKIIDKIQPGEKAEKQLKETNEKPLQNPREDIFQSVEIEAHAENGDPVAIDTLKMLKKAGNNKDWRTIIKEAYTNVVTQFKNFISGGDNQLQEAPQAATGSLDAVNKTRFEAKIQEDLKPASTAGKSPSELVAEYKSTIDPEDPENASDCLPAINSEKSAEPTKDPEHQLEGHITKVSDIEDKPIGWLEAAQKIAQLPFDKQLQVIGAGLSSGINEYNHQQRERSIGAVIGTVQGVGTIAVNLAKITDFTAALIKGDKEAAAQGGSEFGEALGMTIVGGVRLFEGAHHYLNDVGKAGYEGDYTKVFRDIDNLGKHLDKAWSELPPREQSRIISKLGTELAADGLIGLGAAKAAGKLPGQFTKILDTISNDAQRVHRAGKNITEKSVRAIEEAVDPLVDSIKKKISPRWAHATAYGDDVSTPGRIVKNAIKGPEILERRRYTSPITGKEISPAEAAKEAGIIKSGNDPEWKKLKTPEKDELLKPYGYKGFDESSYHFRANGIDEVLSEDIMSKRLKCKPDELRSMTPEQLKETGITRIEPINGQLPINSKYAGRFYELDPQDLKQITKKHPQFSRQLELDEGIYFKPTGFPEFTPYVHRTENGRTADFFIELTGQRTKDFEIANEMMGWKKTPRGWTWHHHEEAGRMQLVPSAIHERVNHTGGCATSGLPYKKN